MDIYRAALLGIAGVLFGLLFKGYREEYSLYLSLAAGRRATRACRYDI